MIIPDQKRAIMTIMARRKPDGERVAGPAPMKEEVVRHEDGEIDARHVAAQDILAALHEKSPERLMDALGAFHDIHANYKGPSESEV